jgi:signal transduction histidine kinase
VLGTAAGTLELSQLLAAALGELDRHLPLGAAAVWVTAGPEPGRFPEGSGDRGPPALVLAEPSRAASAWLEGAGLSRGARLAAFEAPFARCLEEGLPYYADWRRPEERNGPLAERLAAHGATACFAVPLRCGDRTAGVLQSICRRAGGFTREQIQLLHLVADVLGPAISNCQLFEQTRKAYEDLRAAQHQLVQAEKMRALGELAGGMAHDFNNSLCGVIGFLELALGDPGLPPGCHRLLQSARTSALDAAHTVKRVQAFARGGGHEMRVEPLDLNELARQTLELTRHKWHGLGAGRWGRPGVSGGGTPSETSPTPPDRTGAITPRLDLRAAARVRGNASELRELLTNLVFNAVDAMPEGGTLLLRTWSTPGDVFLAVQDTGKGIPEAVRRRLFEPFFSTKGERGTGLGLSVSFGIVRRHNGEIQVESELGRGATFTVRLPALAGGGDLSAPDVVPGPPAAVVRTLRVLVVEDEEGVRAFLAAALAAMGYRPRLTANGEEALRALGEEAFDLVLTDLGLPGVSGEGVARAVAQRSPTTPVVLLTGWGDQIAAETKPVDGVWRVLSKPVKLSVLTSTLREVCGS